MAQPAPTNGAPINMTLEQLGQAVKAKYPSSTYSKYGDFVLGSQVATKYPTYQKFLGADQSARIPKNLDKHIAVLKNMFDTGHSAVTPPAADPTAQENTPGSYKDVIPNPVNIVPNMQPIAPVTDGSSPTEAGASVIPNMVSSGINFAKGFANLFNPIDVANKVIGIGSQLSDNIKSKGLGQTLTDLGSNLPGAAEQVLVPQFIQHILSGDPQKAGETIANDPVGQILPLVLMAQGAAEKAGYGEEFNKAIETASKPVTKTASFAGDVAGKAAKGAFALETGKGMSTIEQAYKSGREGGSGQTSFTSTMRGTKTPEQTAETANDTLGKIIDQRNEQYKADLQKVNDGYRVTKLKPGDARFKSGDAEGVVMQNNKTGETFSLTKGGVKQIAGSALRDIGIDNKGEIIDFSKRPSLDAGNMQKVQSMIYNWDDMTPEGLNQLRQEVDGFKKGGMNLSPADNRFNHYVDSITGGLRDYLGQVPEIGKMNKTYAETTGFLKEIKRDFSLGDSKALERGFKNLTTAMKTDNQFKLDLLNDIKNKTGIDLQKEIAGHNLSTYMPGGLVGRSADAVLVLFRGISALMDPSAFAQVVSTSPRLVGEMLNGLGIAKRYQAQIISAFSNLVKSKDFNLGQMKIVNRAPVVSQVGSAITAAGTTGQDNQQQQTQQ